MPEWNNRNDRPNAGEHSVGGKEDINIHNGVESQGSQSEKRRHAVRNFPETGRGIAKLRPTGKEKTGERSLHDEKKLDAQNE